MSYYSDGEKKSDILLIILLIICLITLFMITLNNSKKIQTLEKEVSSLKKTVKIYKNNSTNNDSINETTSEVKENTVYEIENNETNEVQLTEKDKKVIDYLNDINSKTDDLNTTEKSKAKGIFIGIVDFLFYDGKINDVSFSELSDNGKKEVLKLSSNIDDKLDSKYPDYKSNISQKTSVAFNKASDIIKKGSYKLSDFSKEKLGQENYNEIIKNKEELKIYTKDAINIIGETTGKITSSLKDKIIKWYENIKN